MCQVMVWEDMIRGILVGISGMLIAGAAYPLYVKITSKRKQVFAPEIFRLSNELENQ